MDKVTGEARIALLGKKDLTNDLLEKILSWMPRDKDCKSQVADLIHRSDKFLKLAIYYIKQDLINKIIKQQAEESTYSGSDEEFMMLNNYEEHDEHYEEYENLMNFD